MKNHNHGLWMVLCCLLPILAISILPAFGVRGSFSTLLYTILIFACPLMMINMMMGGHQHDEEDADNKAEGKNGEHKHKEGGSHGCH